MMVLTPKFSGKYRHEFFIPSMALYVKFQGMVKPYIADTPTHARRQITGFKGLDAKKPQQAKPVRVWVKLKVT
jgi:hypothetical protein